MTIGERIKKSRNEKGLSQSELAALVNTTKMAIVHIESHDEVPNPREVSDIADALGVPISDLVANEYMPEFALETTGYLLQYMRKLDASNENYEADVKALSTAAELLTYTFNGPYYNIVEVGECADTIKGLLGVVERLSDIYEKSNVYEAINELAEMIRHVCAGRKAGEY